MKAISAVGQFCVGISELHNEKIKSLYLFYFLHQKIKSWTSKMTQWVKILVTKHDKLSLIPGTLEMEGEN